MNVEIANPIYDVVFKYMMEDNAVAKLLISSIIGEKVVRLDPKPQEHTTKVSDVSDDKKSLTVYRLDFSAKIKTPEGYKLITIETQKASLPTDIKRFRTYLESQIYAIYFLGKDLEICDTPVLSVSPEVRDVATQKIVNAKSRFIELLNHKCWIVQINCLKQRRRNELEQLLSIFDQENRTKDQHVLNVNENVFPKKYHPLIRRLKSAASSKEVKKQMSDEDEVWSYIKDVERIGLHKGRMEMKKILDQKNIELEEKDKKIEEKDRVIADKDKYIEVLEQQLQKYDAQQEKKI